MKTIDKIVFITDQKGIIPSKMAKDLGFSSGLYSQWKSGLQNPSAEKLFKIAEYLDCSVDYLLGRTDIPEVNKGNNIKTGDINGDNNANIVNGNSVKIGSASDSLDTMKGGGEDAQELLDMIKQLSLVQRAEIILKINEMLKEK